MTTTDEFQIVPPFYTSEKECIERQYISKQTNTRYSNFTQGVFHAGDVEQFNRYRLMTSKQIKLPNIDLSDNIHHDLEIPEWEKYKDIPTEAVDNTFMYLFHKFKKGVFVKIEDNRLKVFLPFSKHDFVNEWSHKIRIDPNYENMTEFMKYVSKMEGRKFNPRYLNRFVSTWYANNCLVRSEYPINEADTNILNIKNMLEELCQNREIPDVEFFINKRDYPIIKRDSTEPYNHMWDSDKQPLVSHNYDKYLPIFSMVTNEDFADLALPTYEDWARVQYREEKYFPKCCREFKTPKISWNDKKDIAVFRGASTGAGTTTDTNMRLKVSKMSAQYPNHLDAGITKWNARPRKIQNIQYLQTIDTESIGIGLKEFLTIEQQAEFKYIINIEGHVSALRLSLELGSGSVILLVKSVWKLWYSHLLIPYEHYVPVNADLSNLIEVVEWCRENDEKCEEIAKNARQFYDKYLSKDSMLDYLQSTLYKLKQQTGIYLYTRWQPHTIQIFKQLNHIYNKDVNIEKTIVEVPKSRNYNLLKGLHLVLRGVCDIPEKMELVFQSKLSRVETFNLGGFDLISKTTNDSNKFKEHIHEAFMGINCINRLIKRVPNFVYTFKFSYADEKANIITERVIGTTLFQYINGTGFTIKKYLFILLQICLALHEAQRKCCFVHNDLTPWNIMLKNTNETYDYVADSNLVYRVKTDLLPVIIDYGKTHAVYKNKHYGFVNPFDSSSVRDIITLLTTSLHQICKNLKLSSQDMKDVVTLANFFSGTQYHRQYFHSLKQVKSFLYNTKSYSKLLYTPKYEMENKTPMDLFNHIIKSFGYKFPIQTTNKYENNMAGGSYMQVYNYISCENPQDRLQTFQDVFDDFANTESIEFDDDLYMYYTTQRMEYFLDSTREEMEKYCKRTGVEVDLSHYKRAKDHLREIYDYKFHKCGKHITPDVEYFKNGLTVPYDFTIFNNPERIVDMVNQYKKDVVFYFDMAEDVLLYDGGYKLKPIQRKNITLPKIDMCLIRHNVALQNTINRNARYTKQLQLLEKEENDCERYVGLYKQIIQKLEQ